jgi:hypothetical protein
VERKKARWKRKSKKERNAEDVPGRFTEIPWSFV